MPRYVQCVSVPMNNDIYNKVALMFRIAAVYTYSEHAETPKHAL